MSDNIVRYDSRTFSEIKTDLVSMIKEAYPSVFSDFIDSNVGSMLIDINAGVTNNLSVNTDRVYQETTIDNAQQRASIFNIARNMGFNIPPKRPSITVVDFSVEIPNNVYGQPNPDYLPVISSGAQVIGSGKIFETHEVIDFSQYNSPLLGNNKSSIANYNSNGTIISHTVTKREIVINGSTSIFRRVINSSDIYPFFSITLPDTDVIEIESVILLEGTSNNLTSNSIEFNDDSKKYFEVNYLAQQSVFIEDNSTNVKTGADNVRVGKWFDTTKKFIKEYDANGFCTITFGAGDPDTNMFKDGLIKEGVNRNFLNNFLSNTSLGERLKPNYTLYVKYRIGGGSNSNIGANLLTQLGNINMNISGSDQTILNNVKRSLKVNNKIAAIGGNDGLSVDQIRQLIKHNFSSQNRCISLTDYLVQIYKMDGKFGSPYRANVHKENNKVIISMLGIGSDGKLSNTSNSVLKNNIGEYLSKFRSINDYVVVRDGRIINLSFEVKLYIENISDSQISNNVIKLISDYFNIGNNDMNQDVFLGRLEKEIFNANGVINIISMRVFNKVGNGYSLNTISQEVNNSTEREITIINNSLYSDGDSMFEIKYPEKDIKVLLVKSVD